MDDVFCWHTWTSEDDDLAAGRVVRHHRCTLRPSHRGGHRCACGARTDEVGAVVHFPPRRFVLDRTEDPSGVSGVGIVAEGVEFNDGAVALRWLGPFPSTAAWDSIAAIEAVHGHSGKTIVRWAD